MELTPHLGDNSLSTLFTATLGGDLVDDSVLCACGDGEGFNLTPEPIPSAIVLLGVLNPRKITWDRQAEMSLKREKWV